MTRTSSARDFNHGAVQISRCELVQREGLHDDGWCGPKVRMRLSSRASALVLTLWVWVPPDGGDDKPVKFEAAVGRRSLFQKPPTFMVKPGEPTALRIPVGVRSGDEVNVALSTPHRLKNTGSDRRELAFVLRAISIG